MAAIQQAVDLFRKLAKINPERFLSNLAETLDNLGGILGNMGRPEAALAPGQEAVDILREVASTKPDAFEPALARSLSNFGARHANCGLYLLARDLCAEALSTILPYFVKHPRAHRGTAANAADHLHRLEQQHGAAIPDALVPIVDYFVHHGESTPPNWSEADLQRAFEFVPPYAQHPPPSPEPTEPVAEVTETAPPAENIACTGR